MVSLAKVKAIASIDLLSLASSTKLGDIKPPDRMDGYKHFKDIPLRKLHNGDSSSHKLCENYETISIYFHEKTGNRATLCSERKLRGELIPSYKVTFESSYKNPLKYEDVKRTVRQLRKFHGADFRISEVHLAIDFVNQQNIDLNDRISRRIKPGKKRTLKQIDTTDIYGAPRSACRIEIYDKSRQLRTIKGLNVSEDICRVEVKMKMPGLGNYISSLEQVGVADWSWLYGPHFSFHFPNARLISEIGKVATNKTIWELRDLMKVEFGISSSNFYRDYLKEHRWLSAATKSVLRNFRWNAKYK